MKRAFSCEQAPASAMLGRPSGRSAPTAGAVWCTASALALAVGRRLDWPLENMIVTARLLLDCLEVGHDESVRVNASPRGNLVRGQREPLRRTQEVAA